MFFFKHPARDAIGDEDDFFADKQSLARSRSMHLEHKEKKYHVQFLKDYDAHDPVYGTSSQRRTRPTDRASQQHLDALFGSENALSPSRPADSRVQRDGKQTISSNAFPNPSVALAF